jgi:hypothetical protein
MILLFEKEGRVPSDTDCPEEPLAWSTSSTLHNEMEAPRGDELVADRAKTGENVTRV